MLYSNIFQLYIAILHFDYFLIFNLTNNTTKKSRKTAFDRFSAG